MIRFIEIDSSSPQLIEFYNEHLTEGLFEPVKSIQKDGRKSYILFDGDNKIIAATSVERLTNHLTKLHSSLVHTECRGKGWGRFINEKVEEMLKDEGCGKVVGNVYVKNISNIILKLKMGYIIEGTLRDHDYPGQHEYIISKML